jgi:hypothetical protein
MKHIELCLIFVISNMMMVYSYPTRNPFYIIAHMINSGPSLDWIVSQGANAIENDLRFDDNGYPSYFERGGICDCICAVGTDHICQALQGACEGPLTSNDAAVHMEHVARLYGIALYFIDSKVNAKMGSARLILDIKSISNKFYIIESLFLFRYKLLTINIYKNRKRTRRLIGILAR